MDLLNTTDAARFTGLSRQTLATMRITGRGPVFAKLGSRVFYDRADLERYVAERKCRSTSERLPTRSTAV